MSTTRNVCAFDSCPGSGDSFSCVGRLDYPHLTVTPQTCKSRFSTAFDCSSERGHTRKTSTGGVLGL